MREMVEFSVYVLATGRLRGWVAMCHLLDRCLEDTVNSRSAMQSVWVSSRQTKIAQWQDVWMRKQKTEAADNDVVVDGERKRRSIEAV
jgi:hypothetical protein